MLTSSALPAAPGLPSLDVASLDLPSLDVPPPVLAPAAVVPSSRLPLRPPALVPMYVSFATLQALDYHSTTRAVSNGIGREANPLVRPIVNHRPAFVAVKTAATVAIVWQAERMWKKHPVRAIVFMAAANSAMATIVARNYSIK